MCALPGAGVGQPSVLMHASHQIESLCIWQLEQDGQVSGQIPMAVSCPCRVLALCRVHEKTLLDQLGQRLPVGCD
jgi:hypothetical protein